MAKTFSDDVTKAMTANNLPSPNVVSASAEFGAGYEAFKAFDHVITGNNKWLTPAVNPTGWIKFDFGSTLYLIKKYTILIPDEATEINRAPKNWTFQGSNNDSNWTTIDTQTNQVFSNHEKKEYEVVSNLTMYRYYKLNVTANNGNANYLAIQEIRLMTYKNMGGGLGIGNPMIF